MSADDRQFRGVSCRTDRETDLRLDRLAMALSKPGEYASRGYAAKVALLAGLEALEVKGGAVEPPPDMPRPGKRRRSTRTTKKHGGAT